MFADTPSSAARRLAAITPHDTNNLASETKALYVGVAGTVSIIAAGDTAPVSLTVPAGAILPIRVKRVRATGTTATGIVGLY